MGLGLGDSPCRHVHSSNFRVVAEDLPVSRHTHRDDRSSPENWDVRRVEEVGVAESSTGVKAKSLRRLRAEVEHRGVLELWSFGLLVFKSRSDRARQDFEKLDACM